MANEPPARRAPQRQTVRFGEKETEKAIELEKAGRFGDAAAIWERAGENDRALAAYQKAGQVDRAVHLLKRTGRGADAARLLEEAGQPRKAALVYEEIHDLASAGKALVKAGERDKAAAMFEQAGEFEEAARLFGDLGNFRKAVQLYDRAGRSEQAESLRDRAGPAALSSTLDLDLSGAALIDEGRIVTVIAAYLRAGNPDEAAHLYGSCQKSIGYPVLAAIAGDADAEHCAAEMFVCANDFPMAAKIFENLGDFAGAAAMYERADDPLMAAEMFARVGDHGQAAALFQRGGHVQQAALHYEMSGDLEKAAACFDKAEEPFLAGKLWIQARKPARAAQSLQRVPAGDPHHAEAAQLLSQALAAGGRSDLAPSAQAGRGLVSVMDGFEFLKATPLFRDLSLEEMKTVYDACETRRFSDGEVMVEQDKPGEALFVLRRGNATVVRVQPTAIEPVARLGPGSPVGEMALIDDSFTSARVLAEGEVEAFVITREAFSRLVASSDRMALKLYRSVAHTLVRRLRATSRHLAGRSS